MAIDRVVVDYCVELLGGITLGSSWSAVDSLVVDYGVEFLGIVGIGIGIGIGRGDGTGQS